MYLFNLLLDFLQAERLVVECKQKTRKECRKIRHDRIRKKVGTQKGKTNAWGSLYMPFFSFPSGVRMCVLTPIHFIHVERGGKNRSVEHQSVLVSTSSEATTTFMSPL